MKKILSFALVLAMMLPMIIMPVSATEPAWTFADEFEELDARNIGQYQIDVGAAETTGVVVDGKVDANDNYTVTQVFNFGYVSAGTVGTQTTTHPDITVKMARKGTALYIAFIVPETEADSKVAKFQLGMGVSEGPTLSHAVKRANMFLNANGTYAWNSLTYYGGKGGADNANNPFFGTGYIDEYKKTWVADANAPIDGGYTTYEVNIDLNKLAFIMTTTKTSDPATTLKMLQIMFFYYPDGKAANCYYFAPGGAWNNENNPYKGTYTAQQFVDALKAAQTPVHTYGATSTVIGHPIAFGGEEVQLTRDWTKQDELGAVGTDVRNLDEGHVIELEAPAAVAPVIDGAVSDGEYTVTNKTLTKAKNGYGDSAVKANFAYKDGYLYVAVTTADTQICKTQIDMGVLPYSDFADTMVNRCVNQHSVAGVNGGCGAAMSLENAGNGWQSGTHGAQVNYGSGKYKFIVDYAAKLNSEGKAVYEYKISLATFAEFWKNVYPVSEGFTYFGFQFWAPGSDGSFDNGDQYGFRSANSIANLKAIDCAAWGLEWVLYTISIPETVDGYKPAHMVEHNYNDALKTADAASARVTSSITSTGLRFKSTLDAAFIENVKIAAGEQTITYGTLIAPADYVTAAGALTIEALEAADKNYAKVIADINNPYDIDANGNVTIAGSITNIKEANLDRDFCAVAFVQYGDTIVYSSSIATRNISDIADAAVKDTKAEAEEGYMNKIADGVFSPYTAVQYALLQGMVVTPEEN